MRFESLEEIINYAIEKEKEAVAFYEDAAGQEAYSGGKKLFSE
ncbi:MAG: rubrerythrin, partial [Deltaproteobacteria bacterium]|nr:rubrerythrin [Deltaproteobacteria bacterium]